jgi:hypothetical protein
MGFTGEIPADVLESFAAREQQITPCEAFLGVIVPLNTAAFISGEDLLWFVDNQAAGTAMVKGSSSLHDVCSIVTYMHLMFAELSTRAYFDYVDSDANPSDGLSRDGMQDAWTLQQDWILQEAILPDWTALLAADFHEWRSLIALGMTLGQTDKQSVCSRYAATPNAMA